MRVKQTKLAISILLLAAALVGLILRVERPLTENQGARKSTGTNKLKNRSSQSVFNHSLHSTDNIASFDGKFQPVMTCSGPTPRTKIIFLHVFKTAGTSFREFFHQYAKQCHKAVAIVVGSQPGSCVEARVETMRDPETVWMDRNNASCIVKFAYKGGERIAHNLDLRGKYFTEKETAPDVVIGHVSYGMHNLMRVDALYIAFFREPNIKYVSATMFLRKFNDFDTAIKHIKEHITKEQSQGKYYNQYPLYLTSQEQRQTKMSQEDRIQQIKDNILRSASGDFIIGIVERMEESNELIEYAIDGKREFTAAFDEMNNPSSGLNKATLSTSALLRELEKDADFMVLMNEYLKYERDVYNFALQLHLRQYEWFRQMKS